MNITEQIEDKFKVKIEDLNALEKETYFQMLEEVQKSQLTIEKIKGYISNMRDGVAKELIDEPEFTRILFFKFDNRKQILLKARLKNYILLESFLTSPERAKEQLENAVSGLVK